MSSLADILADRGEMRAALQYNEQVTAMRTEEYGERDPMTLSSVARLASLYRAHGHYSEAARIQQQVIDIAIQDFPDDNFFLVRVQNIIWCRHLRSMVKLVQTLTLLLNIEIKTIKIQESVI